MRKITVNPRLKQPKIIITWEASPWELVPKCSGFLGKKLLDWNLNLINKNGMGFIRYKVRAWWVLAVNVGTGETKDCSSSEHFLHKQQQGNERLVGKGEK